MNTTTTISDVERINDAGTRKHFDPHDAAPYWTRLITCHGGGHTITLVLHARHPDALELLPMFSLEAQLTEMDTDTLDALANAVRAERQSRDPQPAPDAQDYPTAEAYGAALLDHEAKADDMPYTARLEASLAAEAANVTVTEDDGVPF